VLKLHCVDYSVTLTDHTIHQKCTLQDVSCDLILIHPSSESPSSLALLAFGNIVLILLVAYLASGQAAVDGNQAFAFALGNLLDLALSAREGRGFELEPAVLFDIVVHGMDGSDELVRP
jgi:uncharacterized protein YejL (UPF0352 family)